MHGYKGKILLLGGTAEGYALAEYLVRTSANIITSLAGRTQNPRLPAGQVRIGSFGGVDGLADYLRREDIRLVIDATHPFATQISANTIAAASQTGISLLRLERPSWQQQEGDNWIDAATPEEAAAVIPEGARVFLAIGRQYLAAFSHRHDLCFVARMIELPTMIPPFRTLQIILGKPENTEDESRFLMENRIGCIVCRNSGGKASYSKIIAARQLGLPVIMISRRPIVSTALVTSVEEAMNYIYNHDFIRKNIDCITTASGDGFPYKAQNRKKKNRKKTGAPWPDQ